MEDNLFYAVSELHVPYDPRDLTCKASWNSEKLDSEINELA